MKSICRLLLLIMLYLLAGVSYGQKVAVGLNLGDLPEQIYGASLRIDPVDYLYVEAFGSYRPLKNRSTSSTTHIRREGTVYDISFGLQKKWQTNNLDWSFSIGPYFQRKQFRGQETCRLFAVGDCDNLLPERLDIKVIGFRPGLYLASEAGWYFQAYSGIGLADSPSEEEVKAAEIDDGVMINHNGIFAHARLILGWQFDLRRK